MFSNEREAWDRLRSEFSQAFELAARGEWERIDELETLGLGPAVKLKSLHVYFPDKVLPVYSTAHLRHYPLEAFGSHTFHRHDGGITYKPSTRGWVPFTRSGWAHFTLSKRASIT